MPVPSKADTIKSLNDAFRQTFNGGQVLITQGIAGLLESDRHKVIRAVKSFSAFTPENDPHGEHDFGSFEFNGEQFFWKIDYYDRRFKGASDDPSDPKKTSRVLTIMRAGEY